MRIAMLIFPSFALFQVCKKQFRQSSTLNNHIKIHVADKPFLQELQEVQNRFKEEQVAETST